MRELLLELLAARTATETLERWCARDADTAPLLAERLPVPDAPLSPDAATRAILGDVPLLFRHVRLRCGARLLAVAENWYVPARLTPAMNLALTTTDASFGRVVAPLGCRRRTLSATVLPEGEGDVLELRAVLDRPDGVPVCLVRERIAGAAVDWPGRKAGALPLDPAKG